MKDDDDGKGAGTPDVDAGVAPTLSGASSLFQGTRESSSFFGSKRSSSLFGGVFSSTEGRLGGGSLSGDLGKPAASSDRESFFGGTLGTGSSSSTANDGSTLCEGSGQNAAELRLFKGSSALSLVEGGGSSGSGSLFGSSPPVQCENAQPSLIFLHVLMKEALGLMISVTTTIHSSTRNLQP